MHDLIPQRARHFGLGDKHGGWLFAADVACCVEPNTGDGLPRAGEYDTTFKVSARAFAEAADRDKNTVLRYLRAWDAAAHDGLVRPSAELAPDDSPDLPDADLWASYLMAARLRQQNDPDRLAALTAQAEADGISVATVAQTANNPAALRSAILADPRAAEIAYEALKQRIRDQREAARQAREAEPDEPEDCGAPAITITIKESPVTFARRAKELVAEIDRQHYEVPRPGGGDRPWLTPEEDRAITRFRQDVEDFAAVTEQENQRTLAAQQLLDESEV